MPKHSDSTALAEAATNGYLEIVRLLLAKRADPYAALKYTQYRADKECNIHNPRCKDYREIVEELQKAVENLQQTTKEQYAEL